MSYKNVHFRRITAFNFARIFILGAICLIAASLTGCHSGPEPSPSVPENPVFHLSNYSFEPQTSLIERVAPIPPFVLSYIEEMDGREYVNYTPTGTELDMIEEYLSLSTAASKFPKRTAGGNLFS